VSCGRSAFILVVHLSGWRRWYLNCSSGCRFVLRATVIAGATMAASRSSLKALHRGAKPRPAPLRVTV
jgi:hypothetical protein